MKNFKAVTKKLVALGLTATLGITAGTACGSSKTSKVDAKTKDASGNVVLKGIVALTPHQEILDYAKDDLKKEGIVIEVVNDGSDDLGNERVAKGEADFNYFQHEPYLQSVNDQNGYNLVNAGDIHVEPISLYSDKYKDVSEIKDGDVIAIPNDGTNEYRALSVLEDAGFITLDDDAKQALDASVKNVKEYKKKIKIVEIDAAQIIPTKDDYNAYITNTNRILEAKITPNRLAQESAESPYANIIAVKADNKDNPNIRKLVKVLQSEKVRKFIEDKYDGAVIPAALKK